MQMRFILGLLIVAALMVLSGGPGAARADIVVGTPLNISKNSSNPVAAADLVGDVIIAGGGSGGDIFASHSTDGGATWSPAAKVNNGPAAFGVHAPFISPQGGGVAWITQPASGNTGTLNFTALQGAGVGPPFQIDGGVLLSPPPIVAGDQFHMATWFAIPGQQAGHMDVYSASSSDGGQHFDQPSPVDSDVYAYSVARDLQGASFTAALHTDGTITVWRMDDQGSWHLEQTTIHGARSVAIERTEDGVMVHWETKVPPVQINAVYRKNGTWMQPINLSGSQTASGSGFAYSGLNQLFTWIQINHDTSNSQVVGRVSTDNGLNFGPISQISPADQGATNAQPFLNGNVATVVYEKFVGSSTQDVITSLHLGGLPSVPKPTGRKPFAIEAGVVVNIRFARAEAAPVEPRRHLLLAWSDTAPGGSSTDIFVAPVGPSGDENCDGVVDAFDALGVLRIAAGLATQAACGGLANVDCMGDAPDAADAIAILDYAAGTPKTPPAGCSAIGA